MKAPTVLSFRSIASSKLPGMHAKQNVSGAPVVFSTLVHLLFYSHAEESPDDVQSQASASSMQESETPVSSNTRLALQERTQASATDSFTQSIPQASTYERRMRKSAGSRKRRKSAGSAPSKRQKVDTSSTRQTILSPSSSKKSQCCSLDDIEIFRVEDESEARGLDVEDFSLQEIAKHLKVNYEDELREFMQDGMQSNDHIASKCITEIANMRLGKGKFEVLTNREVKLLQYLPHLYASSKQRPGVVLYTKDKKKLILSIEVQSSQMKEAERKATLGAKDLIRFLRFEDPSFTGLSVFCFPNCQGKQCIVEIKAVWKDFYIYTTLTRYHNIAEGIKRLGDVILEQRDKNPDCPRSICLKVIIMPLSPQICACSESNLSNLSRQLTWF